MPAQASADCQGTAGRAGIPAGRTNPPWSQATAAGERPQSRGGGTSTPWGQRGCCGGDPRTAPSPLAWPPPPLQAETLQIHDIKDPSSWVSAGARIVFWGQGGRRAQGTGPRDTGVPAPPRSIPSTTRVPPKMSDGVGAGGAGAVLGQLPPTQVGPGGDILGPELTTGSRGGSGCIPSPTACRGTQPQAGRLGGGVSVAGGSPPAPPPAALPGDIFVRPSAGMGPGAQSPEGRCCAGARPAPKSPSNKIPPPVPGGTCEGRTWLAAGVRAAGCRCWTCLEYFPCWRSACAVLPPHPRRAGGPTQRGLRPCPPRPAAPNPPSSPKFRDAGTSWGCNPPFSLHLPHGHVHGESRKSIFIDEGILSKSHPNPHTSTPELRGKSWIPFMCNRRCLKYQNSERSLSKCKG